MPPDAALFVSAVIVAYTVFIVTLAWAQHRAGGPATD